MSAYKSIASSFRRVGHVYSAEIKTILSKWYLKVNNTFRLGPFDTQIGAIDALEGLKRNTGATNVVPPASSAADYEVWGAVWARNVAQRTYPYAPNKGIVRMVEMVRNDSATGRRRENGFTAPQASDITQAVSDCAGIPAGRLVLNPYFITDESIGGNDEWQDAYYKGTAQGTTFNTVTYNTPWQTVSASESKTVLDNFITSLEGFGYQFNYVCDDQEQYRSFGMEARQNIGPVDSPNTYITNPNAIRVQAIVNDARYTTTTQASPLGTLSFDGYLRLYAEAIDQASYSAKTKEDMVLYWLFTDATKTTRRTATQWGDPYTVGQYPTIAPQNQTSWYAWDSALRTFFAKYRYDTYSTLASKPYFKGWSNYETFSVSPNNARLLRDYNTHRNYGAQVDPVKMHPCVVLYGEAAGIHSLGFGGVNNPTGTGTSNPIDWYSFKPAASSDVFPGSAAHCGFLVDLQKLRFAALGEREWGNTAYTPMSVWVSHPSNNSGLAYLQYPNDTRYWYEILCHAAVLGTDRYWWFNVISAPYAVYNDVTPLSNFLDDLRTITGNSKMISCTNATASTGTSPSNFTEPLVVGKAMSTAAISGGLIMSGTKAGQKLWRVTVPPNPAGATGTRVTFSNPSITATIPNSERGMWLFSATTPVVSSIAAI